ncbi:MAG: hypothetical protein F9K27_12300 [Anaerolineae bacterium]|nr:MAG: hypothetical protein F9K27_12300 [Anaerolineae bacterium]
MFLEAIALIRTMPCLAEPGRIIVMGKPSQELTDVLPYLAVLPNVISYNPNTASLTFRRQPGFITLLEDRVFITQVKDIEEGLELLSTLVDAINATWDHRHELKPVMEPRRTPRLLDVWSLLPKTNCRQCGEATCMSFAAALLQSKRKLQDCTPLMTEDTFIDQRTTLAALL